MSTHLHPKGWRLLDKIDKVITFIYYMQKTISISYGFNIGKTIDKIIAQQINLPANIAFALYKLYKQLIEMEEFVFQRLNMICGENVDFNNMTENQKILYSSVFDSEITIDVEDNINIEKVVKNNKINLTIQDIDNLNNIFDFR